MRLVPIACLAIIALAAACLNDRPVSALGGNAAVALRVAAPASAAQAGSTKTPQQSVEVAIGIGCYNCARSAQATLAPGMLFDHTYDTDSGSQRIAATFPFAPCAGYYLPDALGTYCDVSITITLREDTLVVDQQYLYGIRVRPGVVTSTDTVLMGTLRPQPPVISAQAVRGIDTRAGVIWYALAGDDVNGDITFVQSTTVDSAGCGCNISFQLFPKAVATVAPGIPPLYAVIPGLTAASYIAQLGDSRGNLSYSVSAGVDFPISGTSPDAYAVTSDTTVDSLYVTATGFSYGTTMQQVDFVVHSVPNQSARDTVYMVCSIASAGTFSNISGSCPRVGPHFTAAMVAAVPVDSFAGGGYGVACALGQICNVGLRYPRRTR